MTLKDFFKGNETVAEWNKRERETEYCGTKRLVLALIIVLFVIALLTGCKSIDPTQVYWNVEHEAWLHTGDPTLECVLVDTTSGSPYCHEWTRVGGWIPPYQEVKP